MKDEVGISCLLLAGQPGHDGYVAVPIDAATEAVVTGQAQELATPV